MIDLVRAEAGESAAVRRLRRAWWGVFALSISAVVDLGVTLVGRGGPPTRLLVALGAALVALTMFALVMALTLNAPRFRRARTLARRVRAAIALALLTGLFGFGLFLRPELVYAHTALALAITAALLVVTLWETDAPLPRRNMWLAAFVIVALVVTVIRIRALTDYPNVDIVDEPWNLSKSIIYLETGSVSQFTVLGRPGDWSYYTTYYIPRWSIPVAWWLGVTGIGLWQARVFDLLVMGLIAAATARAAYSLYGRAAGFFTAAALFASGIFMLAVRVRPDIGLALALAVSLWLYSEARRSRRDRLHLLAGLVMGWGAFGHYHALAFGPIALVALYLPGAVARRRPERAAWLYALGLVVGLGLVGIIQVLPDVDSFLLHRAPRHPGDSAQFFEILFGYLAQVARESWYEAILIALGLAAALKRRAAFDWSLLMLVVFGHIALAVMTNAVKDHYLVPLTPVYGLLVGALLGQTVARRRLSTSTVGLIVGLCLLMPAFGSTLKTPVRNLIAGRPVIAPALPGAQWVRDHVSRDRVILAENDYYLWLYDYGFISTSMSETTPDEIYANYPNRGDFWLSLNPDVVILDPDMSSFGDLRPLLAEGFMEARGYRLVAEFPGRDQPVLVYARDGVVTQ